MLPGKTSETVLKEEPCNIQLPKQLTDYSEILNAYGLEYKAVDYYLQVGEIIPVQGWILHISVVISQISDLMEVLLPQLIAAKVPFKIPVNKGINDLLLGGMFGYINLGKVICIYPDTDSKALELAQKLMVLTTPFKGPDILTDIHLGAVVYARYGSFNPILRSGADGSLNKYIYNHQGKLVQDNYPIPFILPEGVNWPFAIIKSYSLPPLKKFLNDCIKPIAIIKPDVKGRVIKGMYLKSWFQAKHCLVKEGKKNMYSDEAGRDIQDRLEWQLKLHNELSAEIPIPKIIDCFRENGDLYLAMEFIEGIALEQKIRDIYEDNSWIGLSLDNRLLLLDYLLKVLHIIQGLHKRNYVHRDITSGNFLVDKKNQLHIIDLELTYSTALQTPLPPYGMATPGHMSPEQLAGEVPTIKEDIYGLGALMIELFTGFWPLRFETAVLDVLKDDVYFFTREEGIADLIANCMHPDAQRRPGLPVISDAIQRYRNQLSQSSSHHTSPGTFEINENDLKVVINKSLNGLISGLMTSDEGLWFSRAAQTNTVFGNPQLSSAIYPGMYEGVAGVLFILSQIRGSGFELNANVEKYCQCNMEYLRKAYLNALEYIPPGLYMGSAGVALMLAAGMECGLLEHTEENIVAVRACLERDAAVDGFDLVNGAAGQGLSILQCMSLLPESSAYATLQQLITLLLNNQQKDGAWVIPLAGKKKKITITGLAEGTGGIAFFLLMAGATLKDDKATHAALKALHWLQKQAYKKKNTYTWRVSSMTKQTDPWLHNGAAGIALIFIKAYELLQEPAYKRIAEGALNSYPAYISAQYLSHAWGLTGLGEVYLEAWRVFKTMEWKLRADWIAGTLLHLHKCQQDDACYWLTGITDLFPTADFMTGNSGIIHFLTRCLLPGKLQYPIISTR